MPLMMTQNPVGRPRVGYKQKLFDEYIKPEAPRLLTKALELAMAGEPVMLKFLLEKLLPKVPRTILDLTGNPKEQINKLMEYFSTGEVNADDAIKITGMIEKSVMLTTMREMAERMERIEQWQKDKTQGITYDVEHEKREGRAGREEETEEEK